MLFLKHLGALISRFKSPQLRAFPLNILSIGNNFYSKAVAMIPEFIKKKDLNI